MKGGCSPWPGLQPRHMPMCLSLPLGSCRRTGRDALQVPGLLSALGRAALGSALFLSSLRFLRKMALACRAMASFRPWLSLLLVGRRWLRGGCLASGKPVLRRPEGSGQLHQRSACTQSTVSFLLHKLARTNLVISSAALTGACLQGVIMQA